MLLVFTSFVVFLIVIAVFFFYFNSLIYNGMNLEYVMCNHYILVEISLQFLYVVYGRCNGTFRRGRMKNVFLTDVYREGMGSDL